MNTYDMIVKVAIEANREDGASWQRAYRLCYDAEKAVGVTLSGDERTRAVDAIYKGLSNG